MDFASGLPQQAIRVQPRGPLPQAREELSRRTGAVRVEATMSMSKFGKPDWKYRAINTSSPVSKIKHYKVVGKYLI